MLSQYSRNVLTTFALVTSVAAQTKPEVASPAVVSFDKPVVNRVDPSTLAKPFETKSARRSSKVIPQPANAKISLPKGFKINVFAEGGFREPRWMALAYSSRARSS